MIGINKNSLFRCGACDALFRACSSASGGYFQKASFQIFVMEYRVSRLTASATKTMIYSDRSNPAFIITNFAQNPDNGGNPAMAMDEMRNRMDSRGGVNEADKNW